MWGKKLAFKAELRFGYAFTAFRFEKTSKKFGINKRMIKFAMLNW
jgi:hypothetical protein